jgi:transcriptional regulator with XRE-family HTH domain
MLKLEIARLRRGLSQMALAQKAGVTVVTIWRIEHGHQRPRPSTRLAIATALDMKIEEIEELANGARSTPADPTDG